MTSDMLSALVLACKWTQVWHKQLSFPSAILVQRKSARLRDLISDIKNNSISYATIIMAFI
jgi:hypothetical protein